MMRDVIVIGAGPGGMTAALYAARANLKVAVIEQGLPGGQMNNTDVVENYPGYVSIKGMELGQKMHENIKAHDIEEIYGVVTGIEDHEDYKVVLTTDNRYEAKTVIIATGAEHRMLNIPGEEEFSGRGVSYCAVCDGAFFKNKKVAVVGGGDSAIEEGLYLTQMAESVTVIHRRDKLRACSVLQERAFTNDKMHFIYNTVVEEVIGNERKATQLKLKNQETGDESIFEMDGVFIYIGLQPNAQAFTSLGITDKAGWIETDEHMQTKIPGVFAIGDVRKKELRQITTAVADGAVAGQQVFQYIEGI